MNLIKKIKAGKGRKEAILGDASEADNYEVRFPEVPNEEEGINRISPQVLILARGVHQHRFRCFSRSVKMSYFIEIPIVHETNLFNDGGSAFYGHMVTDGLGALWGYFLLKWHRCIDFALNCKSTNMSVRGAFFNSI